MGEKSYGIITAKESGQQIDISKMWKFFNDKTIFQSIKGPGVCLDEVNDVTTVINEKGNLSLTGR